MKKNHLTSVLRVILFCAVLLAVIWGLSRLLVRKESMERFQPFLDAAEEFDVVFIGNSHTVNDIFPLELWNTYGIAAYNLGGNGNTLPVTYWQMRLAFQYGKPKLVVLDMNDIELPEKVTGNTSNVHTTLDVYPISRMKIEAIQDLMNLPGVEDFDGNDMMETRWEYLFLLGKYHSRWNSLTGEDLFPNYNKSNGAHVAIAVRGTDDYDITDDVAEEEGYGFEYLRELITWCQSNDIQVLLVNLPYPANYEQQTYANAVQNIAWEYGLNYINFVSLDQVVDYTVDLFDGNSHLNPSGAKKTTDYLGDYIRNHYDIPDRRDDPGWANWAQRYADYLSMKAGYLNQGYPLQEMLMLGHDPDFSVCCMIKGNQAMYEDDLLIDLIQNIPREHVYEKDAFALWSNSIFPLEHLEDALWDAVPYLMIADRGQDTLIECTESDSGTASFGSWTFEAGSQAVLTISNDQDTYTFDTGDADIILLYFDKTDGHLVAEYQAAFPG